MIRLSSLKRLMGRPIYPETTLLIIVCTLDMAYTLVAVRMGWARESNPLLKGTLQDSDWAFVAVKSISFLLPLAVLELYKDRKPAMVRNAIRAALVGYVLLYICSVYAVHVFHQ